MLLLLQPFPSMSVWSQNDAIKSCRIYHEDKNGCFILDQIGSDVSKMDFTWPNWFKLDQKRSRWIRLIIWFKSDKNGPNQFKLDQLGSSWFKLVQTWIKIDQDESDWLFGSNQIKFVQIGSNQIKLVQIGSSQIKVN
jgi:hypothetical protein